MPTIVTTGKRFTDIDACACVIAYSDLLYLQNVHAVPYLPGVLNQSISKTVTSWPITYTKQIATNLSNQFVVMDVSDPEHFAPSVSIEQVIEIYDHHYGFEDFWYERLGDNAKIEMIGSCATLVWEEYIRHGFENMIDGINANLLYTAIISNTLNFNASVTDQRDIDAAEKLLSHTSLPPNWVELYYREQDEMLLADIPKAVHEDTKVQDIPNIGKELVIGQMELWDSKSFVHNYKEQIKDTLQSYNNPNWFMTAPSISEGKNYLYTESNEMKDLLQETIQATFDGDIGTTEKLWLRKEILKVLQE